MENIDKSVNMLRRNEDYMSVLVEDVRKSNISGIMRTFCDKINAGEFLMKVSVFCFDS